MLIQLKLIIIIKSLDIDIIVTFPIVCDKLTFVSDIPHCCRADGVGRCTKHPVEANIGLSLCVCVCVCVCVCDSLHKSIYHYLSFVISYSNPTDLIVFLNQIMAVCWKLRLSPGGTETGTAIPLDSPPETDWEGTFCTRYFIYIYITV